MELIIFIKSINKIAIFSFFITFFLLCFEIYLLIKQKKRKKNPFIPEFKANRQYSQLKPAVIIKSKEEKTIYKTPNLKLTIVFFILMLIFGGLFVVGRVIEQEPNRSSLAPTPSFILKTVTSAGIKIYNEKWEEIPDEKLSFLKGGDKIFVGIKSILGADVDKARIRINSDQWTKEDEVSNFNQKLNLFYREYQIATEETKLKIEAQLHSKENGWLAE